jgi:hypothetical protein
MITRMTLYHQNSSRPKKECREISWAFFFIRAMCEYYTLSGSSYVSPKVSTVTFFNFTSWAGLSL